MVSIDVMHFPQCCVREPGLVWLTLNPRAHACGDGAQRVGRRMSHCRRMGCQVGTWSRCLPFFMMYLHAELNNAFILHWTGCGERQVLTATKFGTATDHCSIASRLLFSCADSITAQVSAAVLSGAQQVPRDLRLPRAPQRAAKAEAGVDSRKLCHALRARDAGIASRACVGFESRRRLPARRLVP